MFLFRFIQNDMNGKSRIGVMPRFGDAESIMWFDVENHCSYHLFNCFEDGNEVIINKRKNDHETDIIGSLNKHCFV